MRVGVMAAGGVGGYFGARLQQAGHDVVFFARGRHLEVLKSEGLTLRSTHGDAKLKVQVFKDPSETKPVDRLRKIFPRETVLGGSAYIATRIAEPGVIEHIGQMATIEFGPLLPEQRAPAEAFHAACKDAGISVKLSDDISRVIWQKFVFLVAVSSTTAVSRSGLGTVRADPDLRWLFEQCMRETWQVAKARGVDLGEDFVPQRLAFMETLPAEMKASMAHDLENGGRLEAPWLCGAVARMAAELGIPAPANRAVFAALKPYVNGRNAG